MNLPYPFESAHDIRPDAFGRIALIAGNGVTLTHIPLEAAYALTPEGAGASGCSGYGYNFGYDCGSGCFGYSLRGAKC
jgi:hypothetical protein